MNRGYLFKERTWAFCLAVLSLTGVISLSGSTVSDSAHRPDRAISMYNIHTKEKLNIIYKRKGDYVPNALQQINHIMRDWRRNEPTKIDPRLIDLMWELHSELGSQKPIHLISGYRSRKTNNALRRRRGGQAKFSRHILGKAADIHFPDITVRQLRNSALVRERGGVGYYPTSAIPFVHVDTGRVRHWPRLPRYELAALFPSGKSRHVPRDGKPITKKDYKVAMARLNEKQKRLIRLARGDIKPQRKSTQVASLGNYVGLPKQPPAIAAAATASLPRLSLGKKTASAPEPPKIEDKRTLRLASADPALGGNNLESAPPISSGKIDPYEGWARAPEYDDEHPDELSYRPFPILPLMGDKSVSQNIELASLVHPDQDKVYLLLDEPDKMVPLRFRPGLQFAEMLWASEFKGEAVPNLLTGESNYPIAQRKPTPQKPRKKTVARKRYSKAVKSRRSARLKSRQKEKALGFFFLDSN